jgi:hypothetical protein
MVRKIATAMLVLALLLVGYQPISGAMPEGARTATMDMEQPCCPDCDRPAMPDRSNCGAMAGCVVSPPLTVLASSSAPVFFATRLAPSFPDQSAAVSTDATPPFRPPRS